MLCKAPGRHNSAVQPEEWHDIFKSDEGETTAKYLPSKTTGFECVKKSKNASEPAKLENSAPPN